MPIEIREMVIKAFVKLENEVNELMTDNSVDKPQEEAAQTGVEQISMMLKQENER